MPDTYSDKMEPDDQVSMEEKIAARIFDMDSADGIDEEEAQEASQDILMMILREFRPDLLNK